jgi:O-antigen/teichoic acid export membrane protein
MEKSQLKLGLVLSYVSQGIVVLSGVLYTPVLLRFLGQNEFGLYQLVNAVVSNLALLNFGFGSSYMRFYSQYKAKNEHKKIAEFNGMFLTLFLTMSFIAMIIGSILYFNIDKIFAARLTPPEIQKAKILMIIIIANMMLMFPNTVFDCQTTAHEKFAFQKGLSILTNILNPFIMLPLLLLGYRSVTMVLVTFLLSLTSFICNIFYSLKVLKVKFKFVRFDFSLFKQLGVFTFFIYLNIMVNSIFWSVDKMLLGGMVGTVAVAIYGVAAQIQGMYQQLTSSVGSIFITRVNRIVAETNDDKQISELFTRVGRFQFILVSLILTGFLFFGRSFIAIWAGDGYQMSYRIALILMIPAAVDYIQTVGIEIQRAKNKHQLLAVIYLFVAVSNIFISMFCIKVWGLSGAAIGSALTLIIGKGFITNIYYHKVLKINIFNFWKQILKFVPALIVPGIVGLLIMRFLQMGSILRLGVGILVYAVVFILSMWTISMNKSEKYTILSMFIKLFPQRFSKRLKLKRE